MVCVYVCTYVYDVCTYALVNSGLRSVFSPHSALILIALVVCVYMCVYVCE